MTSVYISLTVQLERTDLELEKVINLNCFYEKINYVYFFMNISNMPQRYAWLCGGMISGLIYLIS